MKVEGKSVSTSLAGGEVGRGVHKAQEAAA